ncbi:GNAT family N-acetyltransferase [bacterium]|nr:GNAT family N-acetyltransferase [bacterium]
MLDINFKLFPLLSTVRLDLRQVRLDDAYSLFGLRSDPRVMKFMDKPLMQSVDEALEAIQKIENAVAANESITWAISLKNEANMIGTIGFWKIIKEHHRAEIGYLLHPDHWGKGLMQEAIVPILNYGFSIMRLHSVEANVNTGNAVSIRFLEKNGFVREAFFKENYYFNGQFLDSYIYSKLAPKVK